MSSICSLFMFEVGGTPLAPSLTCLCCRWSLPVGMYRSVRESDNHLMHNDCCVLRLLNSQAWNGIRLFKDCSLTVGSIFCWRASSGFSKIRETWLCDCAACSDEDASKMLGKAGRPFKDLSNNYVALSHGPFNATVYFLICGNKMPTRCNRGFYCRSYCLLNMFCLLALFCGVYTPQNRASKPASCKPDT